MFVSSPHLTITLYVYAAQDVRHCLLTELLLVGDVSLSLLLVSKGASDCLDADGISAITHASFLGMPTVVSAMLSQSSGGKFGLHATNSEGITPLIAAASEGHFDVVRALLQSDLNLAAVRAAETGAGGSSGGGKGGTVDVCDKDGTSALMAAAVRGFGSTVEVLVAGGADVNLQNLDGHTALMFAVAIYYSGI